MPGNATVTRDEQQQRERAEREVAARVVRQRGEPRVMRRSPRAAARRLVASARANSPRSRPRRITSTRSDMPRISGSSEEIMITPPPACGELAGHAMHGGLRAHVDALGGLIEDQHARRARQPLGDAPPSAGCRPTGCAPPAPAPCALIDSRSIHSRVSAASRARLHQPRGASVARFGSATFAASEKSRMPPCDWRSSGTSAMPAAARVRREMDCAAVGARHPEQASAPARCARAHEAVDAEDLAAAQRERDVFELAGPPQVLDAQQLRAGRDLESWDTADRRAGPP